MKRGVKLIIAFSVLTAAVAGYAVFRKAVVKDAGTDSTPSDSSAEEEEKIIFKCDIEEISGISYKSPDISYKVVCDGEGYIMSDKPGFPLDTESTAYFFDFACSIEYKRKLTGGSTEEYGLDDPQRVLTVYLSDGTQTVLNIGNYNKYIDGYYAGISGSGDVYVIKDTFTYYYDISLDDIIAHDKIEAPAEEFGDVTSFRAEYSDGSGFVLEYIPEVSDIDDEGNEKVISEAAWVKKELDGTRLDGDHSGTAKALYKAVYEDEHKDWIDYNTVTEEKLGGYGLEAPYITLTVTYGVWGSETDADGNQSALKTEESVSVYFGDRLPEADGVPNERYYRIENGEIVYAVTEESFSALFS